MPQAKDAWRRGKQQIRLPSGRHLAVVDTKGDGATALLLHGYTDTSRSYQAIARYLGGFRLVIPDLPGHGDSAEDSQADLSTIVEDLAAVADHLDCAPSLVIGHSFGSLVALEIARQKTWSDLKIVTLAGSPCPNLTGLQALDPIRRFGDAVEAADPFLTHWYSGPVALDPQFLALVKADAVRMPVRTWHHYLDLLEKLDLRSKLEEIEAPLLSIAGDRDQLFGARHVDALGQGLRRGHDIRLPGVGHNPHWEAPQQVATIITDWLDALVRDRDRALR
ncbi:alpha/beta fold hydrolase [Rhizobium sp. 'Codium 1']|uniref:alpha/beta fold hydrolase n=1 Tax=Rhizobium sp. 'Codium 1' TaxID=2940484 RepID=UPI001E2AA68B|nr:alpha/beta hydrolase [Rhizobium sp. 'Codium 1']MCC8931270.1 alpha/beta hydrolase [Rhizobium sp. 'Codium 1']